jgi:excisionase family DNA binding protein
MVRNLSQLGFYWHIFCCQTDESKEKLIKRGKKTEKMETDVVLTTNEAIQYLKISKPTFLKYVRLGRIRAIKAGSGWRVHKSELHRFLKIGKKEEED